MMLRRKKALSPLVATAILISAAMAGGLLLYQYFNSVLNTYTTSENIIANIHAQDTGSGSVLFIYNIKNVGNVPVNLTKIIVYQGDSIVTSINLDLLLSPGQQVANSTLVNNLKLTPNMFAIIEYNVRGQVGLTQPIPIRLG